MSATRDSAAAFSAWEAGFAVGKAGADAGPPASYGDVEEVAWRSGYHLGRGRLAKESLARAQEEDERIRLTPVWADQGKRAGALLDGTEMGGGPC